MNVVFAHGLGLEGNRGRRTCSRRAIGHVLSRLCLLWVAISVTTTCATTAVAEQTQSPSDTSGLAKSVTIYRDAFGTPHIDGANDAAVRFSVLPTPRPRISSGKSKTRTYWLWDATPRSWDPKGLNSDLLNRAFEIVPRSQADYDAARAGSQDIVRVVTLPD